jgi:2,4-dienoyl-CoA reductase-like NADH-dependent reductase (Old Yellow Enzyme family)
VTLPNRIGKSAMSENLADSAHLPGERLLRLWSRWAGSGAGLLITGNVMIDRTALGEAHNVVIEPETDPAALRPWAEAGQAGGAVVWPQLNHPGRQSPVFLSREPVAPSAVPMTLPGRLFRTPRALREEEILDIVRRFGAAAGIVRAAGFGGVQIHGAHGYLVSQFLSPLCNLREDGWGGDAERRRRFLLEVVRAVRGAVGAAFPLGVKLNSADFQRGGFTEEESMDVVVALQDEGVDLLEISGGTYERPAVSGVLKEQRASTQAREAYFLQYAKKVRARTTMPLMLTGGFRTRAGMEEALGSGAVDLCGVARAMALEPEFPRGLLDGTVRESAVVPRRTGVRALDGLADIAAYSDQLRLMGDGREPDPALSPWCVLAGLGWRALRDQVRASWGAPVR